VCSNFECHAGRPRSAPSFPRGFNQLQKYACLKWTCIQLLFFCFFSGPPVEKASGGSHIFPTVQLIKIPWGLSRGRAVQNSDNGCAFTKDCKASDVAGFWNHDKTEAYAIYRIMYYMRVSIQFPNTQLAVRAHHRIPKWGYARGFQEDSAPLTPVFLIVFVCKFPWKPFADFYLVVAG